MAVDFKESDAQSRREFGERFSKACDDNPNVPPHRSGRATWIRDQLEKRYGTRLSLETLSRWFAGEARPRSTNMNNLAELLNVDLGWLAFGITNELTHRDRRVRAAMADGAVNLVAGLIQLDQAIPGFPPEGESTAVDVYATIKGVSYPLHVCLGEAQADGDIRFAVAAEARDLFKLGVLRVEPFNFRIFELTNEMLEATPRRSGSIELAINLDDLAKSEITSFANRF